MWLQIIIIIFCFCFIFIVLFEWTENDNRRLFVLIVSENEYIHIWLNNYGINCEM